MFALKDSELDFRILDCAGGASSFAAQTDPGGQRVVACDPVYASPDNELSVIAEREVRRGNDYVRANLAEYVWEFFDGPDDHLARRLEAARLFGEDFARHPARYVAASLPTLPFGDNEFELALCSHLLFTYADRLDVRFHVHAISELCRVSSGDVRVFPIISTGSSGLSDVQSVRDALEERKISTYLSSVDYEFQRGATEMLVARSN